MEPHTLSDVLQLIRDGGSTLLLVVSIIGGFKGWYVWRWQYDAQGTAAAALLAQKTKECDEWKSVALRGLTVAEKVTK